MQDKIIDILAIITMIFAVIGIHELGHLIVGLVQGFRFELFVVGPLGIKREDHKIKVYFNTNLQYFGGVASTIPVEDHPDNADKFAKLILAGPVASLLLGLICVALYFSINTPPKLLLGFGIMSFGIFLATTIPSKSGIFFTDRKRYQRLMSTGNDRVVELALLRIIAIYGRDNSYQNIDQKDIDTIIEDPNYSFFGLFTLLCYQHEINGAFDPETKQAYDTQSKQMSKSFVKAMNKELDKLLTS